MIEEEDERKRVEAELLADDLGEEVEVEKND